MANAERGNLRIRGGRRDGGVIPLSQRLVGHVMGRSSDSFAVVSDPTVSRRHALIFDTTDGFILRDLASKNGTYVNGRKRVGCNYVLRHGDRIRLGGSRVEYVFELAEQAA